MIYQLCVIGLVPALYLHFEAFTTELLYAQPTVFFYHFVIRVFWDTACSTVSYKMLMQCLKCSTCVMKYATCKSTLIDTSTPHKF